MRGLFAVLSLALYAGPAFSAATGALLDVVRVDGDKKPNSYIVKLKDGVSKDSVFDWFSSIMGSDSDITHSEGHPDLFNGFAGTFTEKDLDTLRSSKDVEYITEDGYATASAVNVQTNAPWGLSRISSRNKLPEGSDPKASNYEYRYDDSAGEGVDVYVIDTGIFISHPEFEGRARIGATFISDNNNDENGHGTHVAGTVGSKTYGVAKKVNLIAVKVLGKDSRGSISGIISGVNWVSTQAGQSGRPSIASMSLGAKDSKPLDDAVASLIKSGVHSVVAAGNDNIDAKGTSPARVPAAITVGATDINDARSWFSNYGASIDVFAPGSSILSTTHDGKTGYMDGTSMATPHVSGLVATFLSKNGKSSPAYMSGYVKGAAHNFAVSNNPFLSSTTQKLAYNLEGAY